MEKFEKLNEFVEGNLDVADEQALFSDLATDDELRTEFKQLMAISSTIKNNRNSFQKNENTKKSVFAALGLSVPIADAVSTASGTAAGVAGGIGLKSLLTTGLISAIATGVIVFFTFGFNPKSETVQKNLSSIPVVQKYSFDQKVPVFDTNAENKRTESDKNNLSSSTHSKELSLTDYSNKNVINNGNDQNESNTISIDNNNGNKIFEIDSNQDLVESNSLFNNNLDKNNNQISIANPSVTIIPELAYNEGNNNKEGWSFELRGAEAFNSDNGMQPQGDTKFINNVISVMYNTKDNWSFGAEVRREAFFLNFEGTNFNGINYEYEQMPTYNTLSILTRYKLDINGNFDPFAQLSFGGNKIGVIGRSTLGIMYSPFDKLSFVLAGEYSNLFYQYQGKRFNSGRFGLTYGVQLRF